MSGINERNSVQQPIIERLVKLGWTYGPGDMLAREMADVLIESDLTDALAKLNPPVAKDPLRAEEVLRSLRTVLLGVDNDGLVEANATFTKWLRGLQEVRFVGEAHHHPVTLIDFATPSNNRFVVSDEVTYGRPGNAARFDIVLYVNGIPLVLGETKTIAQQKTSWFNGAKDFVTDYEPHRPEFFVPNVFNFASEGKELAYAPIGSGLEGWEVWGPSQQNPRLENVLASVDSLLAPATVLSMLNDFTLFEQPDNNLAVGLRKIIARYMQFDAVNLMCERAHEGIKRRGLIYHTQGTGKTLAMVFAAAKMMRDPSLGNPTIIMVADRVQLVTQMWDQFRTTGMPRLKTPGTAAALRSLLADFEHGGQDQRGLVFTTVHKFAGAAPGLNQRRNIIVLVDEAHRTQEGDLGLAMRAALPNALMFAFSGTPLATLDRNTFATFGDPDDPGRALHSYTPDQAVADGVVVPIHVTPRLVKFQLHKEALDQAFADMAVEQGLDAEEAEVLAKRATRVSTFFTSPVRIQAVCADIIEHFYSTVDPLGMKAQIVVVDRAACVAYHRELTRQLADRAAATGGVPDEAAVVMTVGGKDDDADWEEFRLSDPEEDALLKRFRTFDDPLKFLIVTSKLGTGFNAPIEGVMYLDKPLKDHTLFQTITRANRTWKNPDTHQAKRYGLIVDYLGLGDGFARAMAPANPEQQQRSIETEGLVDAFEAELAVALLRFAGIDPAATRSTTLLEAQKRLPDDAAREAFQGQFDMLAGIWETVYPDARLALHKTAYRFLSKVYASLQPSSSRDALLWARLGAKTLELVHEHMTDLAIDTSQAEVVVADADTLRALEAQGFLPEIQEVEHQTADQVIDSIAARLRRRMAGANGKHPVYKSLAERLDKLRERQIEAAQQSIDWLRELLTVARDLKVAEKSEDEGGTAGLDLLPDPRVGALTQIFREYAPVDTPESIERIVLEVDGIVREVTADNSGWAATQKGDRLVRRELRGVLRKFQLDQVDGLFDRAYEYIAEHY